jgi:rhodanese-related sulfurtransferase
VNIAVEDLQDRLDELTEYMEQPIAIVCRTDKRSAKAALLLAEHGFHDVHVVRGGMTKWIEANLPVIHQGVVPDDKSTAGAEKDV